MSVLSALQRWVSGHALRMYCLFLALAVLPIGLFAFSASRILRRNSEQQALREGHQAAELASILVEQQLRESVVFLESYAYRYQFSRHWVDRDLSTVNMHLAQAFVM